MRKMQQNAPFPPSKIFFLGRGIPTRHLHTEGGFQWGTPSQWVPVGNPVARMASPVPRLHQGQPSATQLVPTHFKTRICLWILCRGCKAQQLQDADDDVEIYYKFFVVTGSQPWDVLICLTQKYKNVVIKTSSVQCSTCSLKQNLLK